MRGWLQLPALLLVLLTVLPVQAQQDIITVTLEARPADCVKYLQGAGQYPRFSQVTIRAKPVPNCAFLGWEIVEGAPFDFTSANPFILYAEGDFKAVAVFERLYEGPEGVVERVLINPVMNISIPGYSLEPIIARPGQRIRYVFPEEITLGERKYMFIYVEIGGSRQDSPVVELQAPERGVVDITAHYYTYIRFLNEYYPIDQFVEVQADIKTVGDSERMVPKSYSIGSHEFPMDQKVPRQLLGLVKIAYARQFRVILASNGAEPQVIVNEKTIYLAPSAQLWVDEGSPIVIAYPERFDKYLLRNSWVRGLTMVGLSAAGNVTGPVILLLEYEKIPNIEFLETPYIGYLLYGVAELGSGVAGVEGLPALMVGAAVVMTAPISVIASSIMLRRWAAGGRSRRGGRTATDSGLRTVLQPILTVNEAPAAGAGELERSLRAGGRIRLPPEIADLLTNSGGMTESDEGDGLNEEIYVNLFNRREEGLAELLERLERSEEIEATPYLLCHIPWREMLKVFKRKRVRVRGDLGYALFETEGAKILGMLRRGVAAIVVESPDLELGVSVVESACRDAGLRAVRMETVSSTDVRRAAGEIRRVAAGAHAVIFTPPQGEVERAIVLSSAMTGLRHIIVSTRPTIAASARIPRPTVREYMGIAAAVMAQNDLLSTLSMDNLTYLADMAYSFNGLATLRRAAAHLKELLGKGGTVDVSEALRQVFKQELLETFTREELELIQRCRTVQELKSTYISLVRQLKPGANPAAELSNLLDRMRRLNILVDEE